MDKNTRLEYNRAYYRQHRDEINARSKKYKLNHREKYLQIHKRYRDKNKEKYKLWRKKYNETYPDKEREHGRKGREKLRSQVFEILQPNQNKHCIVCGFADIRALQFDHINGDGYIINRMHKGKGVSNGHILSFYRDNPDVTKNKLQILCANCNQIKRHTKGESWRHHGN